MTLTRVTPRLTCGGGGDSLLARLPLHPWNKEDLVYPPEIQSSMVQYPSQDGTQINAYLSRPAAAGRYPGVVVIMEAFGLNDHIKDVARRFAAQGYIAVAPDMYTREGAPDPSNMDRVIQTMLSVPDTQAVADLDGAIAHSRPAGGPLKHPPSLRDQIV